MITELRKRKPHALASNFRPVLVRIYWPSAVFPVEKGEHCGASVTSRKENNEDQKIYLEADEERNLAETLPGWAKTAFPTASGRPEFETELARFRELIMKDEREELSQQQAEELTAILLRWRDIGKTERGQGVDGLEENPFIGNARENAERWKPSTTHPRAGFPEGSSSGTWIGWANVFTFWTMKERAGIVGSHGVYDLLKALQPIRDQKRIRIHLVGHSFGSKVIASAVTGHGRQPANHVDSMLILQGAISHLSFGTVDEIRQYGITTDRPGRYVDIMTRGLVHGPLLVTLTKYDRALSKAYPRGVAVNGDFLEGEKVEKYGSLGVEGIQGPRAASLKLSHERLKDKIDQHPLRFNVDATNVIKGHSDLMKEEVFTLFWDMVQASREK